MTKLAQYAVFGSPIKHSKSPVIHRLFAEQTQQALEYKAQLVTAEQFETTVSQFFQQGGQGLNCTVPLKELAWQYADTLTERATLSKAVNTLIKQTDGTILGDNTDGVGLLADIGFNHRIGLREQSILILGAGGASRGIILPLLEEQVASLTIANRTVEKAQRLAEDFKHKGDINACSYSALAGQQFDFIINATSASLSGDLPPLPENILAPAGNCYDLAYANEPTAFVLWGQQQNAVKSLDGLGMLVEQAAEAFYLWRDVRPQTEAVIQLLENQRTPL